MDWQTDRQTKAHINSMYADREIDRQVARHNPYRIFLPFLLRVVRLPSTGWKDMFISLVPGTKNYFTSVRLGTNKQETRKTFY